VAGVPRTTGEKKMGSSSRNSKKKKAIRHKRPWYAKNRIAGKRGESKRVGNVTSPKKAGRHGGRS